MEFFNDLVRYSYLNHAFWACILSGITCGIIGTYVVCRRLVFLSGGITHSSFGGLGIAFWMGANPIAGVTISAVLSAPPLLCGDTKNPGLIEVRVRFCRVCFVGCVAICCSGSANGCSGSASLRPPS